eukprot:TRINITY_DN4694_c0_g1_i16.p1 TRINITY_DN4694_c0_g1~~TRINITY_DN4694_c0_g1_i16.p1  ORF type:complete len:487 (+),score=107.39 TRINITY_DN4694_c0_g1_i16:35-1462(+)
MLAAPQTTFRAVARQVRWRGIPLHKIRVGAERQDMLASPSAYHEGMSDNVVKRRRNREVSVFHPGTTGRPRKQWRELNPDEQEFAAEARSELKDSGITDEQRFNSWLRQDHSVFPEKVAELPANLRSAVKFGGLNITSQTDALKQDFLEAERRSKSLALAKDKQKEQLAALGLGFALKDRSAQSVNTRMVLEGKFNEASKTLKEKYSNLKQQVMSGMSDRTLIHERQTLAAEESLTHVEQRRLERQHSQEALEAVNMRREATGQGAISRHDPEEEGATDISANAAVVARCVLASVPTDGGWPIVIPHLKRKSYFAIQNAGLTELMDEVTGKDRGRLVMAMRNQQNYRAAKGAWHAHLEGEETGGVNDARDWKKKHKWEWKSEPKTYVAKDPGGNVDPFSQLLERTDPKDAKYVRKLHSEKQTADKPPGRFHRDFNNFGRNLNQKYTSGYKRSKLGRSQNKGTQAGTRASIAAIFD